MSLLFFFTMLFLIGLSAFFSMSETALVSLSEQKGKALGLNNPSHQRELQIWFHQPHELLTLILTGNTIVNILFASLMTSYAFSLLANWNPKVVDLISWFFSTLILVVFGEMVPKIWARNIPEKFAVLALPWLARMKVVMMPMIHLISTIIEFFTMAPPLPKKQGEFSPMSSDDLKSLLEEGEITSSGTAMESVGLMRRALELQNRLVEKIMTPLEKIDFVELDPAGRKYPSPELIIDLVIENGHTRTPVKKGGRFIGFIHTKDILMLLKKNSEPDIPALIRQPLDIVSNTSVRHALEVFQNSGIHIAFVYNTHGQIIGLVTLEDVLEEMTGEILDEYDLAS